MEDEREDIWLIIFTPNGRYIGKVVLNDDDWDSIGEVVLNPAVELVSSFQFAQDPSNGTVAANRLVFCAPLPELNDRCPLTININGCSWIKFSDLSERDLIHYKTLVDKALHETLVRSAARSGLQLADTLPAPVTARGPRGGF